MLLTQLNDWSYPIGRSFIYLLILVILMFAAYYVTRMLTAKLRGTSFGNLKIIEGLNVGQNGSVLLIKAGKRFMLIGVTKEKITCLAEFDKDDLEPAETRQPGRFDAYLNNFLKGKKSER